ncbi:phenylacetate 2-hydroxylase [Exophiala viscosa]|uniref:Phenylacetate 2-hydroxylase n=1 Tax=Exophiala viscosa TaxID=2486360 RepID=A0AAN6IAU5_9EURO|nr:phenylacetate 2-hydroxylase [Exophiala viscosa]
MVVAAWWLYRQAYGTDVPKIRGLPEAPGAVPFYGHLKALGDDHPTVFEKWGKQFNWPVMQARMGAKRVIVLNSYEAAQDWMVRNASATIDRPLFYTFANVVSTSQGMTIGTSPWDESSIQRSAPMLDVEARAVVEDMYAMSGGGQVNIEPSIFFKRAALNLTLEMCYGTRIESIDSPFFRGMLQVVQNVSSFRSTNNNPQDYVPLLRYLPDNGRRQLAREMRETRDGLLDTLLRATEKALKAGNAKACMSEGLLNDSTGSKLTKDEIKSINVSLVSGGFETLSTTSTARMGMLSTPVGQVMQARAYEELMSLYDTVEECYEKVVVEEKSPYLVALVREMLRFYAAIQLLPPRQTMKSFIWNDIAIPAGVTVFQNAQAINHDPSFYGPTASQFIPERWLLTNQASPSGASPSSYAVDYASLPKNTLFPTAPNKPPYHYSFGAGSRACPAVAISNRVLYSIFARLILLMEIKPGTIKAQGDYIGYNQDTTAQTFIPQTYHVSLKKRDGVTDEMLSRLFATTME